MGTCDLNVFSGKLNLYPYECPPFSCRCSTVDISEPQSKLLLFSEDPVNKWTLNFKLPRVKIQATVTKRFACVVTVTGHILFPFFFMTRRNALPESTDRI